MGSLKLSDLHFAWKELEKLKGCPQNWIFLWKRSRSLLCRMTERMPCGRMHPNLGSNPDDLLLAKQQWGGALPSLTLSFLDCRVDVILLS